PLAYQLGGDLHLRVEVADPLLGLVPHPLPVVAHILGEPLGALPLPLEERPVAPRLGVHRRHPRELRRDLDHRLVDEDGDGVEVARVRLEPEPLRLEGEGPSASEGVVEGRELLGVEELVGAGVVLVGFTGPPPALPDLLPGPLQDLLVRRVLPLDELFDQPEEPLALDLGGALLEGRLRTGLRDGAVPEPLGVVVSRDLLPPDFQPPLELRPRYLPDPRT